MVSLMMIRRLTGVMLLVGFLSGCASEFVVFDSLGKPLLLSRRGFTSVDCIEKVTADAARMEMTVRYVHVRGTVVGRSLLWPLEPGYACEAAIGPQQGPTGTYPMDQHLPLHGS